MALIVGKKVMTDVFVMSATVFGCRLSVQNSMLSHAIEQQTFACDSCNLVDFLHTDFHLLSGRHPCFASFRVAGHIYFYRHPCAL